MSISDQIQWRCSHIQNNDKVQFLSEKCNVFLCWSFLKYVSLASHWHWYAWQGNVVPCPRPPGSSEPNLGQESGAGDGKATLPVSTTYVRLETSGHIQWRCSHLQNQWQSAVPIQNVMFYFAEVSWICIPGLSLVCLQDPRSLTDVLEVGDVGSIPLDRCRQWWAMSRERVRGDVKT